MAQSRLSRAGRVRSAADPKQTTAASSCDLSRGLPIQEISKISGRLTQHRDANSQYDKGYCRNGIKLTEKRKSSSPRILPAFRTRDDNHRKSNYE